MSAIFQCWQKPPSHSGLSQAEWIEMSPTKPSSAPHPHSGWHQ
jgi:hypothetical protein